jgi:hypothetical protein
MTLWVCKSCETIGPMGRIGWYSSAPACSTCGHRTTVPADSAKGADLIRRWGITADQLSEMEWRAFSYAPRVFWLVSGSAWTAVCLTGEHHNLGVTGTAALFSAGWAILSLVLHFRSRPRATGTSPPAP